MDLWLLEYYNCELSYLWEIGVEFVIFYFKIVVWLGMQGIDIVDLYVECMIEVFSFLSVCIQLKIDVEFFCFIQWLLEVVSFNYVIFMLLMVVVKLYFDMQEGDLVKGVIVLCDIVFVFFILEGENIVCQFCSSQDVMLWLLFIEEVCLIVVLLDMFVLYCYLLFNIYVVGVLCIIL